MEERRHKGKDLSRNSNWKLLPLLCHKSNSGCENFGDLEVRLNPRLCSTFLDIQLGENPVFSLIKQWKPQNPPAFLLPQIQNTHRSENPINICRKFSKCSKSFVTPQQSEPACGWFFFHQVFLLVEGQGLGISCPTHDPPVPWRSKSEREFIPGSAEGKREQSREEFLHQLCHCPCT